MAIPKGPRGVEWPNVVKEGLEGRFRTGSSSNRLIIRSQVRSKSVFISMSSLAIVVPFPLRAVPSGKILFNSSRVKSPSMSRFWAGVPFYSRRVDCPVMTPRPDFFSIHSCKRSTLHLPPCVCPSTDCRGVEKRVGRSFVENDLLFFF